MMEQLLESFDKQEAMEWGKLIQDVGENKGAIQLLIQSDNKKLLLADRCNAQSIRFEDLPQSLHKAKSKLTRLQNVVVCDKPNYNSLWRLLTLHDSAVIVILIDERWTPDWCWQFKHHIFLTHQCLDFS
ncbi:hypothetical protein CS022_01895 [Veronia nyctiphanis]|uniref:Uncharacterized protein n=1 Tax=Veronia nyctiphanis TaxID=1278244 RepID=A0A4Q0YVW4_9GAMM|nr:hypothetical protein [Veronia nyctiphanis]RXJ74955.1 hypothetical protein CS022_01895 [Veronia nyctiphanis]